MTIFNEIPTPDKINALNMYKKSTLADIFRLCIFMGIDTETFDPAIYEPDADVIGAPNTGRQLKEQCVYFVNIKNKLLSL